MERVYDYYTIGDPRRCLNDKALSLDAKGLLLSLFAYPEIDAFALKDLVYMANNGKRKVISAIKELADHGYLELCKEAEDEARRS